MVKRSCSGVSTNPGLTDGLAPAATSSPEALPTRASPSSPPSMPAPHLQTSGSITREFVYPHWGKRWSFRGGRTREIGDQRERAARAASSGEMTAVEKLEGAGGMC